MGFQRIIGIIGVVALIFSLVVIDGQFGSGKKKGRPGGPDEPKLRTNIESVMFHV